MHHAKALKHLRRFERADLRVLLRVIDGAAAEVCERSQALAKRCCGGVVRHAFYLTHCINDKLPAGSDGDPQLSPQTVQSDGATGASPKSAPGCGQAD